jgi:hypothetical protein
MTVLPQPKAPGIEQVPADKQQQGASHTGIKHVFQEAQQSNAKRACLIINKGNLAPCAYKEARQGKPHMYGKHCELRLRLCALLLPVLCTKRDRNVPHLLALQGTARPARAAQ